MKRNNPTTSAGRTGIHLGKTGTSRTRKKKVTENVSADIPPLPKEPKNPFIQYALSKGYSLTTAIALNKNANKFLIWLAKESIEIENTGYNDITSYLQTLTGITQHTKNGYLYGIKQYFNYLIQQEIIIHNPAALIQIKGQKRKSLYDILNRQELDSLYHHYQAPDENSKDKNQNWYKAKVLAYKRNKAILGLLLYQALDTKDLGLLTTDDVKLREGKIYIPGTRRSNERELKLEALQVIDLMEYIYKTRANILQLTGKQSGKLFISIGTGNSFFSIMKYLVRDLNKISPKVTTIKQLRTSVIVHWLKLYNLREAQYMAGHRYVSSTEQFLANEMDEMIEDIEKYHPIG